MRKLKLFAYALGLLALAYPALVPPALGTLEVTAAVLFAVAGWLLAHLTLTFTAAAGLLLSHAFPKALHWLVRSLAASVTVVMPRPA